MIKINMGCGQRNFGKDWIHIDGGSYPHLDFKNIFSLPYKNNSVDLIYASHLIEYFDRKEVKSVLKEWIRTLRPGGILRLAVPDFEAITKLYNSQNENKRLYPLETFLGSLYGKILMNDEIIFHKTVYDFESLKSLLEELGMKNIEEYDWRETEHSEFDDHSQAYIPHMDKENGTLISLNVEGVK